MQLLACDLCYSLLLFFDRIHRVLSHMFANVCSRYLGLSLCSTSPLVSLACVHRRMKMVMLWLHFLLKTMNTHEQCGMRTSKLVAYRNCLTVAFSFSVIVLIILISSQYNIASKDGSC